jgi:hypothetical protein
MNKIRNIVILVVLTLLFVGGTSSAKFITEEEAGIVVQNWLEMTPTEQVSINGTEIREVMRFDGDFYGSPGYYVVLLDPDGWVVIPADDSYEAIIAFGQGSFSREEYARSPLAAFIQVNADNENQNLYSAYSTNNQTQTNRSQRNAAKREVTQNEKRAKRWQTLSTPSVTSSRYSGAMAVNSLPPNKISSDDVSFDVVVAPMMLDYTWNQGYLDSARTIPYFNLFTSWDIRYPVGCTPVAVAQLMRFFEYPKEPPRKNESDNSWDPFNRIILLSNDHVVRSLDEPVKGGSLNKSNDNKLAAYDWSLMEPKIEMGIHNIGLGSPDQRNDKIRYEIASLMHDLGVLMHAIYTPSSTGVYFGLRQNMLRIHYQYCRDSSKMAGNSLIKMSEKRAKEKSPGERAPRTYEAS